MSKPLNHSIKSRVAYHTARSSCANLSEGKRLYSKNWIEGYNDPRPQSSYSWASHMLSGKVRLSREQVIACRGFRAGIKAQLQKNNRS